MCVAAAVLVLQHHQRQLHRLNIRPVPLKQAERVPTDRLIEVYLFDFLQLVEGVACLDGNPLGRVGFVCFEVDADADFLDSHFLEPLDVDMMRLAPITLPKRRNRAVSELIDAIASLRRGEGPDS